jgi:hypothetical protein
MTVKYFKFFVEKSGEGRYWFKDASELYKSFYWLESPTTWS